MWRVWRWPADEVAAEPTDPARHVRLAERLVVSCGPAEALSYVRGVEQRRPFPRSEDWYRCVADICQVSGAGSEAHTWIPAQRERLISR